MQFVITTALRRPLTVMVVVLAIALGSFLAVGRSVCEQFGLPIPPACPAAWKSTSFRASTCP